MSMLTNVVPLLLGKNPKRSPEGRYQNASASRTNCPPPLPSRFNTRQTILGGISMPLASCLPIAAGKRAMTRPGDDELSPVLRLLSFQIGQDTGVAGVRGEGSGYRREKIKAEKAAHKQLAGVIG